MDHLQKNEWFQNDHGAKVMNQHKPHRKLNCIKKVHGIAKVGLAFQEIRRSIQMFTVNSYDSGWNNPRKTVRIEKSQRNCVPPWNCVASHVFGKSWEIIGAWLGSDVASPVQLCLSPVDYHLFRSFQNTVSNIHKWRWP